MRTTWLLLLGLAFLANGGFMLLAPEAWYALTPGVAGTGPLNVHFVRDVGCAYLVAGLAALWLIRDPRAWPAALAGGLFLALHAAIHVADAVIGRVAPLHIASDALLVVLPAGIVLWYARPPDRRLI